MKVWITGGSDGQLYSELHHTQPSSVELVKTTDRLDITDAADVSALIKRHRPELVINAAAYTAVDRAESEPELAFAVNDTAVENLCVACRDAEARLIQISTDFVFDGRTGVPYHETDTANPLSVYGKSKLAGEKHVAEVLPETGLVVRTSWGYAATGNNFVKTMLAIMAERSEIGVVSDQIGTPTWMRDLASAIWRSTESEMKGLIHWTDAGVASWYDFAVAIRDIALDLGLLQRSVTINPIQTSEFPLPAQRPAYSVLNKSRSWQLLGMKSNHWRRQLETMMREQNE